MPRPSNCPRNGLTLVELVIVLTILVALAGLVIPQFVSTSEETRTVVSQATLVAVRDAATQYWLDTKYENLTGPPTTAANDMDTTALGNVNNRFQMRWLFFNPVTDQSIPTYDPDTRRGWNGPYLFKPTGEYTVDDADDSHATGSNFSSLYGDSGDPAVLAATRGGPHPVVIQAIDNGTTIDCRVVSAGDNGRIDIPHNTPPALLTDELVEDDEYVAFTLRR